MLVLRERLSVEALHVIPACSWFWIGVYLAPCNGFEPSHTSLLPNSSMCNAIFARLVIFPHGLTYAKFTDPYKRHA